MTAAVAVSISAATFAGVKYWDNPDFKAFDVGDYVQDGLVVNYDGIRNAGPNAPHDPNAMTWVNSANPGTYDMVRYSTNGTVAAGKDTAIDVALTTWNNDASKGSWTDKGFVFDKGAAFYQSASFAIPKTYTIQSLVDATPGDQSGIGYIMSDYRASHWDYCSLGIRSSSFNYAASGTAINVANTMYLVSGSIGKRPAIRGASSTPFTYVTAINNVNDGVTFVGTKAPWDAAYTDTSYGHAYDASKAGSAYTYANGFCLGSHYPRTDEMLKGTIKNFRFYNRCLSDAEVLWNRVVDDTRYFGRGREITVIPVTNVVESCTIAGVRDFHYAIDAEGQTFTAPASKTVNGKRHILSGYTLETWNGSAWGAPVAHNGEFSYTATDTSALVRLTWQYTAASGEGGLKVYGVDDYVTDGLQLFYDGILNQGKDAPHSYDSTTWVNIGNDDVDRTLTLQHKVAAGDPGAWDADGFIFKGYSDFNKKSTSLVNPATHSIQTLVDANVEDQIYGTCAYIYATAYNRSSFAIRTDGKNSPKADSVYWMTLNDQSAGRPWILHSDKNYGYVTAIQDGTANTLAFFDGVAIPDSSNTTGGYKKLVDEAVDYTASNFFLGGFNASDSLLAGKIKFFRYYPNKVLTEEELAQNRKVDEYRYFGRYVVTNVLVQSTYSYLDGYEKCGPYEVDGSYTFTAPETVTAPNGITYACDGYTVETQDGIGWAALTAGTGNSYLYNTSVGTVRLTWKWKATSGLRTAADYSLDDLSPAGLALHYDGLLNQGVGVARSTTSKTWVNLGSRPGMDLTRATSGTDATAIGGWVDDGYRFGGKAQFNSAAGQQWATTFSAQALVDAKYADNGDVDGTEKGHYIAATTWSMFGLVAYGPGKEARFQVQSIGNSQSNPHFTTEDGVDYMTAIHDAATKTAVVFPGTKAPTSGTAADGYKSFGTFNAIEDNAFRLGGWGGGASSAQCLVGTLYSFRYYDRVLTEEEIVRNRNVDAARYFGELGVTNVFVVAGGGTQAETGAYKVEGSWTFTAETVVGPCGVVEAAVRYTTEELVDGVWTNKKTFDGTSYSYVEGVSPATVRLTWKSQPLGTWLIIR